ncbi:MAG: RDD family protein [Rhizobiaceae bacterium]|nr:MAG: RDD family protein [Rhizobiaceae bacterium]
MDDRDWYLLGNAGRRFGPYAREVIEDLHARNELQPDTWVWHTGLAHWQPAHRFLKFADSILPTTVRQGPAGPQASARAPAAKAVAKAMANAAARVAPRAKPEGLDRTDPATAFHPWQRALATATDLLIVAAVLSLLSKADADFAFRPLVGGGRFLWLALWAIADAVLLSRVGTTPGRRLFGVSITGADGKALPPPRAAARSALLLFTVLGGGHLLFGPILGFVAFRFVTTRGQGWWDLTSSLVKEPFEAFLSLRETCHTPLCAWRIE